MTTPNQTQSGPERSSSSSPEGWTPQEHWVLRQVAEGRTADLQCFDSSAPNVETGSHDRTIPNSLLPLSAVFLRDLVIRKDLSDQVTKQGVCIKNAWFDEPVDLSDVDIEWPLRIEQTEFQQKFTAKRAVFDGLLSFNKSKFKEEVDLSGAKIGSTLEINQVSFDKNLLLSQIDVRLSLLMQGSTTGLETHIRMFGAKIGGILDFDNSTFNNDVVLDGLETGAGLLWREATFCGGVFCKGVQVGGTMEVKHSTFEKALDMGGLRTAGSLLLIGKSVFRGNVHLVEANIGGRLDVADAEFQGNVDRDDPMGQRFSLNLLGARIGVRLVADRAKFRVPVRLSGMRVGGSVSLIGAVVCEGTALDGAKLEGELDLSGAQFGGTVSLSDASVGGVLRLEGEVVGKGRARWLPGARLSLTNARIGAIQAETRGDSWPGALELNGLVYERLLGPGVGDPDGGDERQARRGIGEEDWCVRWLARERADPSRSYEREDWHVRWLARDEAGPSQPYQQLAKVLRDAGADPSAVRVLYERRELDRRQAPYGAAVMLWLQKSIVGYGLGLGYFRSLLWVALCTGIGTAVLWSNLPTSLNKNVWWCFFASFDEVLPFVELKEEYAKIVEANIENFYMKYFYFQRIVGYVLGSFIVAGLAGLTQTSSKR